MDFHDFATAETSGLMARLLANQSGVSRQQLQTLRDAIDTATQALNTPAPYDQDLRDLVERLTQAADTAVQRTREEARATIDRAGTELEQVRSESERLAASVTEAQADAAVLRTELQAERERADAADRDLAATVEAHAEVEAAYRKTEAALKRETQAKTGVEDELRDTRARLEATIAEMPPLRSRLEAHAAESIRLEGELAAAQEAHAQLEAAHRALEASSYQDAQAKFASAAEAQESRRLLDAALIDVANLRSQAEQQAADLQDLTERHTAERASLLEELAAARTAHQQLEILHSSVEAAGRQEADAKLAVEEQLQEVRGLLDLALADADQLRTQVNNQSNENFALRNDLASASEAQGQRDAVAAELAAASARVQNLESSHAFQEENIRTLQSQLDDALRFEAQLQEQMASRDRDASGARFEVDTLRGEVNSVVSLLDESVRAVEILAESTSVSSLLGALVRQLSTRFSRVALFRVKGNRLEGEHHAGFDQTTDVTKLVIPLNLDSMLTRVVSSGDMETLRGSDLATYGRTPFGGMPAAALTLPLVLQGETIGVLYADHASAHPGALEPAASAFARLLVGQTIVLLTRHTHELKTLTEMREYASMLLQEAEQMHSADADAGRTTDELRKRLKDNLDCARQLYAHRAALEGDAAAALLDEQIAATIELGTPFAHDLAAVVGQLVASGFSRTG